MLQNVIALNAQETARALPYKELVAAIARAARELSSGRLNAPERLVIPIDAQGSLLCMPAVATDIGIAKILTVHQKNAAHGLPAIQGEVIVFDTRTGQRLLLLDGPTVTARRTAAVSLLAIDALALNPPRSALLIGTGVQAAAHADALASYFGIRSFWVAAKEQQQAAGFCEKLHRSHPEMRTVPVMTSALESTGLGTDLVIALTTSKIPVVPAGLPDTTLAIGVGAFRPDMAELPGALLNTRRVVVDCLQGAEREAGDLLQAGINWSEVQELSQQLDRGRENRLTPSVFKSVGHASWDLAAARVAIEILRGTKTHDLSI